jgi:hypothetical protein
MDVMYSFFFVLFELIMGDMIFIPLIMNIHSHTSDSNAPIVRPQEPVVETEQIEYVHTHTHRHFVRTFIGLPI